MTTQLQLINIIIDVSGYREYGDNKIFRNVRIDLAFNTKSYTRRP